MSLIVQFTNGKSHQALSPQMLHSPHQHNIMQQNFYYRTIHDWNVLPPRFFDFDNIDKFTNEIQQIYKS